MNEYYNLFRCDGIKDCPFNEDEPIGCKALESCGKEQFMCEDGSCINSTSHCNWHFDCADKSDEKNCFGLKKCASGNRKRELTYNYLIANENRINSPFLRMF